jgi:hypothetical protein
MRKLRPELLGKLHRIQHVKETKNHPIQYGPIGNIPSFSALLYLSFFAYFELHHFSRLKT